jgi:hypothetical protein
MTSGPFRIQRSRAKGWRMPPNTVAVTRGTPFGNPYKVWRDYDGQWYVSCGSCHWPVADKTNGVKKAIELYRADVDHVELKRTAAGINRTDIVKALRGKNLSCWCRLCAKHAAGKPFDEACSDCAPCHADTLGELANR